MYMLWSFTVIFYADHLCGLYVQNILTSLATPLQNTRIQFAQSDYFSFILLC